MTQNPIQTKLLFQINNLEVAVKNIENQLRFLSHDLSYKAISRLTFDVRKSQLEQAKNNIIGSINFLKQFYKTAKRIDFNEFT